ncbi:MAG: transferase [Methylocystaceae bacterium]|nr:MAG: transferase [Methylocystaceae bacterium]
MSVLLTAQLKQALHARGVECLFLPETVTLPKDIVLEPPCSLKWMQIIHSLELGSFSYAVSGFFFGAKIGRYTSIGESVQIGRGDHPTRWLSTSPGFYLNEPFFDVGHSFNGATEFHEYRPVVDGFAPLPLFKPVNIGHDVWIGHGAFIRPGVTIGNGAIIGAYAVVTRDVPPYAIVAGNPASIRRYRFPEELVARLNSSNWWSLAPWQLRGIDVSRPDEHIGEIEYRVAGTPAYEPGRFRLRDIA